MTETARLAHYVLPAANQFEKAEATFFNLEFPHNTFQLRHRLFDPLPGTLPEPEIWARLVRAIGAVDDAELQPLRRAAREGLDAYAAAFLGAVGANPALGRVLPYVLYETLGPVSPGRSGRSGGTVGPGPEDRDDLPRGGTPRGARRRQRVVRGHPGRPVRADVHRARVSATISP